MHRVSLLLIIRQKFEMQSLRREASHLYVYFFK